jgi:hypothetical protein
MKWRQPVQQAAVVIRGAGGACEPPQCNQRNAHRHQRQHAPRQAAEVEQQPPVDVPRAGNVVEEAQVGLVRLHLAKIAWLTDLLDHKAQRHQRQRRRLG